MRRAAALLSGLAMVALLGVAAATEAPQVDIVPAGPPTTVFDWSEQACDDSHVPDAPARAFRRSDGSVALIASHNDNRLFSGQSLASLAPDCSVVFEASRSPRLRDFDDLSWISGIHTRDGETIHALAHTELRGERTQGQCPAGTYSACLLNTVTAVVSTDGGRSFVPQGGEPAVVATLPYPFPTDRTARVGYANPTNIIEHDGWFYAMMFADGYRAQKRGVCLIRTRTLDDPASWRAWDGTGFGAAFVDPFRDAVGDPAAHVCEPVAQRLIGRMIGGLAVDKDTGAVIAVFGDRRRNAAGRPVSGIYYATSQDLLHWSEPSLLMQAPLLWEKGGCERRTLYFYPSLLDPNAETASFQDVAGDAFLYLVRYNRQNCKVTWDRDLVRVPVRISRAP